MTRFQLHTIARKPQGCAGVLCFEGWPFAVTLERTFDDLRVVVPGGILRCTLDKYHKGGYPTYEIQVAGHDRVLFHKGNLETHSEACILVAESFAVFGQVGGIADSKHGFDEFMMLAQDANGNQVQEFELEVTGRSVAP